MTYQIDDKNGFRASTAWEFTDWQEITWKISFTVVEHVKNRKLETKHQQGNNVKIAACLKKTMLKQQNYNLSYKTRVN